MAAETSIASSAFTSAATRQGNSDSSKSTSRIRIGSVRLSDPSPLASPRMKERGVLRSA